MAGWRFALARGDLHAARLGISNDTLWWWLMHVNPTEKNIQYQKKYNIMIINDYQWFTINHDFPIKSK